MDFAAIIDKIGFFFVQALVVLGTLSILVFLHEWGHFIAARIFGVDVLEFSFGMGKLLYGKKWGKTEYQIRAIPMGGFVKLAGEDSLGEEDYKPSSHEFYGVSPLRRLGIVFAGPFMNFFLAFLAFWIVIFVSGETLTKPVIGFIPADSAAEEAGLQSGDKIISINGESIKSFEDASEIIYENPGKNLKFEIQRGDQNLSYSITPRTENGQDILGDYEEYGVIGISPYYEPIVGEVMENSPADKAGLKKGDRIFSINGKEINFWTQMMQLIQDNPGKAITLQWKRNDEIFSKTIVPESRTIEGATKDVESKTVGVLGIVMSQNPDIVYHRDVSIGRSFIESFQRIVNNTVLTYRILKKMIFGKVSRDSLMGPVRLAGFVSDVARNGFLPWLLFLGFISHQLAIINFLPVPALDGGHAVFFIIEFIRGKPLNLKAQEMINKIGFSLLMALFLFVIYNDIVNLLKK